MERLNPGQRSALCIGILMLTMRKMKKLIRSPFYFLIIIGGLTIFSIYTSLDVNRYNVTVIKMASYSKNATKGETPEGIKGTEHHNSPLKTSGKLFGIHTDLKASSSRSAHQNDNQFKTSKVISLGSPQNSDSQFEKTTRKPLKIYVYNISSEFTTFISDCAESDKSQYITGCIDHSNQGMGRLLYRYGQISVHNTNHFSLDVILHHQFAHSQYRTYNPLEADIFYVPAYMGSLSFCPKYIREKNVKLFEYLNTMPYLAQGKPHVTSMAKIEKEQTKIILAHPGWKNIAYITIEKAFKWHRQMVGLNSYKAIVAPYPSYIHFNYSVPNKTYIEEVYNHSRSIFLLFAGSLRVSNPFRAKIISQFVNQTKLSFKDFSVHSNLDQVMLVTEECYGNHRNTTVEWMLNSVFCLQPHGDSPTRKSFYDSILSGCIPVVFAFPYEDVEFPFQRMLNYSNFIVRIPVNAEGDLEKGMPIYDYLHKITQTEIKRLQTNLVKVLHFFQYPVINKIQKDHPKDAVDMIVDELRAIFNI